MKNQLIVGLLILSIFSIYSCTNETKKGLDAKLCNTRILSKIEKDFYAGDTLNLDCRIKDSIECFLKTRLKDPTSYEPIDYTNFRPLQGPRAAHLNEKLDSIEKLDNSTSENTTLLEALEKIESNPTADSLFTLYTKERPIGYKITHRFRAKNSYGALDINEIDFYMDTTIKVEYTKEKI